MSLSGSNPKQQTFTINGQEILYDPIENTLKEEKQGPINILELSDADKNLSDHTKSQAAKEKLKYLLSGIRIREAFAKKFETYIQQYQLDPRAAKLLANDCLEELDRQVKTNHSIADIRQAIANKIQTTIFHWLDLTTDLQAANPELMNDFNVELMERFDAMVGSLDEDVILTLMRNLFMDIVPIRNQISGLRYKFSVREMGTFVRWAASVWQVDFQNEAKIAKARWTKGETHASLGVSYLQHKLFNYIRANNLTNPPEAKHSPEDESYPEQDFKSQSIHLYDLDDHSREYNILKKQQSSASVPGKTTVERLHSPAAGMVYFRFKAFIDAVNYLDIFQKLILARSGASYQSAITADQSLKSEFAPQAYTLSMEVDLYQVLTQDRYLPALEPQELKEENQPFKSLEALLRAASAQYPKIDFYKKSVRSYEFDCDKNRAQDPKYQTAKIFTFQFHGEKNKASETWPPENGSDSENECEEKLRF